MAVKSSRFSSLPRRASGRRYRNSTVPTTSRTIACSCSVSWRPTRRVRMRARIDFCAMRPRAGLLHQLIGEPLADGDDFFAVPRQEFHQPRIKMLVGLLLHVDERVLDRPRGLVGA